MVEVGGAAAPARLGGLLERNQESPGQSVQLSAQGPPAEQVIAVRDRRPVIAGEDYRTIIFADGRGFLDYQVFEDRRLVMIDELTWLDD